MAFEVGPQGTSYVDKDYADGYFSDRVVSAWAGTDPAKEGALVRATDYIRAFFGLRLDPRQMSAALPGVPEMLMQATCQYALVELTTPGSLAPAPVVDASGYSVVTTSRKIGPLQRTFSVVGNTSRPPSRRSFPVADALLAHVLLPYLGDRVIR